MKRPTMLVEVLLTEIGRILDLSVERDIVAIRYRTEHEGLSFLTITLPKLSDSLERGLEDGLLSCPTDFRRRGRLPLLLGGFFSRVFHRSGKLRQDADVECIRAIRQICRFFKKLKIACTPEREAKAVARYLDVEGELHRMAPCITRKDINLDKVSRIIWSQVFPEIDPSDLICHHGPGVTADRYLPNERYRIKHWYTRAEFEFPSDLHCFPNHGYAADYSRTTAEEGGLSYFDIEQEPGVRVVFVPKTLTAPRVIAIEPSSMQYIQQSLMRYMVPILESHRLTKHSVRFGDQSVNQRLAYLASIDKSLATLDLSDASDRVALPLVQRIFQGSGILDYLEAARSLHATLPNGQNIVLSKFASMGSAICFPVEACVFYTLIQACMHAQDSKIPSSQSISAYSKLIDVYGDDLIVPVNYADAVVSYLESYGLKVNVNKSFRKSLFRESCGADFYAGEPVKPVYARQLLHDDDTLWQAEHVFAWTATANLFYQEGLWSTAQWIRDLLERVLRRRIPRSRQTEGPGIYFYSYLFDTRLRYNRTLHRWEQNRVHYDPIKRKDDIDGDALAVLNKWGISRSSNNGSSARPLRDGPSDRTSWSLWSSDVAERARIGRALQDVSVAPSEQWLCAAVKEGIRFELRRSAQPGRASWLSESSVELDFRSSVKRGGFKSKHRWVTIA